MSRLFLAEEASLHRQVVIKLLPPEFTSAVSAARFKQEIEVAAHLQHPNILPVLSAGAKDDLLFYVMPFVSGESLRHRLTREGKLPVTDAVRILHEVADALAHAHAEGVIHRDIKPENILLQGGHAVLTDFGVARALAESRSGGRLTDTGVAIGTPAYMSPEQAAGERHVDARADVYALAVVGYEMLAGSPPFAGPTAQSLMAAHLTGTPKPLTAVRPDLPPRVANTIAQALAKDPNARLRTAAEFRDALGASAYDRRRPSLPSKTAQIGVVAAVVLIIAALGVVVSRRHRMLVIPSASTIAVVPFAPSTPDTALTRLGRDLVVTLTANLDGVGDIRTVDALTVLAQTRGSGSLGSLQDAAALARRLGASSVAHGSLVRVGDQARLDIGLFTTDSATPIARASVTAAPGNLTALTDSATWALLREVWRTRAPPTPSLAAVTTRSIPALRAFLEGERNILDNRWPAAAQAFSRAMQADSTFWLAYRRYAYARAWIMQPVDDAVIKAYRDHRFELPERERLLIETDMTDSGSVYLARRQEITRRWPDYWPGWFAYADALVHYAPFLGHTSDDAQAGMERTLALNPNLTAAWQHLFWMAIEHDTTAAVRAQEAYARLGGGGRGAVTDIGFDDEQIYRLDLQLRRSQPLDRVLLDSVARDFAAGTQPLAALTADWFTFWGFPQAQIELSRRVLRARPTAAARLLHHRAIVHAWVARGAWDSALVAEDRILQEVSEDEFSLDGYRLAVIGAWLGVIDADQALPWRSRASAVGARQANGRRAELAWLEGLEAVARHDRSSLAAARAMLQRSDTVTAALLDRSLAAFELELSGARGPAARALAALEWQRPDLHDNGYRGHPSLIGVNRLAAARWLEAEGDTAQAARLLTWEEAFYPSIIAGKELAGLTYLARARIEDARGRAELARRYYEQFVRRYDMPVPAQRHLVEEAKAALNRLPSERR
jgi:serine/threonine-protein kinase